ncbi:unnamed protein product [Amoebophrya sp. A120]|nr:unnamed protein product [Amoebophrya sp. A120]|eukprot:GSA120T00023389001.1
MVRNKYDLQKQQLSIAHEKTRVGKYKTLFTTAQINTPSMPSSTAPRHGTGGASAAVVPGSSSSSSSQKNRKRPFSMLVEDLLSDVTEFVDEAIGTHRAWVDVKKQEIYDVLQAAEQNKTPIQKNHKWGFFVESEGRIGDIVEHHIDVLRTHMEDGVRARKQAKRARPQPAQPSSSQPATKTSAAIDVRGPPPSKKPQEMKQQDGIMEDERQSGESYHSTRSWSTSKGPRVVQDHQSKLKPTAGVPSSTSGGAAGNSKSAVASSKPSNFEPAPIAKVTATAVTVAGAGGSSNIKSGKEVTAAPQNNSSKYQFLKSTKTTTENNSAASSGVGVAPGVQKPTAGSSSSSSSSSSKPAASRSSFGGSSKNHKPPDAKSSSSGSKKEEEKAESFAASAALAAGSTTNKVIAMAGVFGKVGTAGAPTRFSQSGNKQEPVPQLAFQPVLRRSVNRVSQEIGEHNPVAKSPPKPRQLAAAKVAQLLSSKSKLDKTHDSDALVRALSEGYYNSKRKSDVDMDALFEDTTDVFAGANSAAKPAGADESMPPPALPAKASADDENVPAKAPLVVPESADLKVKNEEPLPQPRRSVAALSEMFKADKKKIDNLSGSGSGKEKEGKVEVAPAAHAVEKEVVQENKPKNSTEKSSSSSSSSRAENKERKPDENSSASGKNAATGGGSNSKKKEEEAVDPDQAVSGNLRDKKVSTDKRSQKDKSSEKEPPRKSAFGGGAARVVAAAQQDEELEQSSQKIDELILNKGEDDGKKEQQNAEDGVDESRNDKKIMADSLQKIDHDDAFMDTGLLFRDSAVEKPPQPDADITAALPRELHFEATDKIPLVGEAGSSTGKKSDDPDMVFAPYPSVSVAPSNSLFSSHSLFSNQGSNLFKSDDGGKRKSSLVLPKLMGSGPPVEPAGTADEGGNKVSKQDNMEADRKKMPPPGGVLGAAAAGGKVPAVVPGSTVSNQSNHSWFGNPIVLDPVEIQKFSPADYFSVGCASSDAAYFTAGSAASSSPESTPKDIVGGLLVQPDGQPPEPPSRLPQSTPPGGMRSAQTEPDARLPTDAARVRREAERKRLESLRTQRQAIRHLKRQEDNYELSDKCSTDEESPDRRDKRVPDWCRNWPEKVQQQGLFDPDTIFGGRVANPDLGRIFGPEVRSKKKRRGSSENWEKDRLTKREVDAYKKRTNQLRPWVIQEEE